jgi:hypothetical protein
MKTINLQILIIISAVFVYLATIFLIPLASLTERQSQELFNLIQQTDIRGLNEQ